MNYLTRLAAVAVIAAFAPSLVASALAQGQAPTTHHRRLHHRVAPAPAAEQNPDNSVWKLPNKAEVNAGTVTVMTGPVGGLTPLMGSDLSRVLDDGDHLRVLPVVGKGTLQNVIDILYLRTVDMGFVVSDVVDFFKTQYHIPDIQSRLRYIAKLYDNDIYIVAPTSIKTIQDLAGKRIEAARDVGYFSAKTIFDRLGIKAQFDYQSDDTLGLQKVIDGKADAWIVSVGKIFPIARNIQNADGRLHLVPIPFDKRLQDIYQPSWFTSDEYPNLIPKGQEVQTLSASVLLATFNWPEHSERYKKVQRFTDAFFSKNAEFLKPPRNPKWREMNLTANVLGWTRFKAAQDWLDRNAPARPVAANAKGLGTSEDFRRFLNERGETGNLTPDEAVKLFAAYRDWLRTRH